jgi:uncharacterized protein YecE (DUF72 family)
VEINYTFRRLPAETTLENWIKATPQGFLFCPKAHQRITHLARLKGAADFVAVFLRSLDPLRATRRLGPILFQLPPYFRRDDTALADFLTALPTDLRYSFEFRHESWLTDEVYKLLSDHNASLCWAESEKLAIPEVSTARFAYFRLRKPEYSQEDLDRFRNMAAEITAAGRDVFLYFKHEETPDGALYAERVLRT